MGWFVVRRLAVSAVLLVVVPSLTYIWFASLYADAPVFSGLLDYLEATFIHFDLGSARGFNSITIRELLGQGVPADVSLIGGAVVIGIGAGMALGALAGSRPGGPLAAGLHAFGALAICAPAPVLAFAFVFLAGADSAAYRPLTDDTLAWLDSLWAPWLAVALPLCGAVMRVSSGATRDALGERAVQTARAKGLSRGRVLRRHVFPFAVPPVSAYSGASVNLIILNCAVVESIFNLPGSLRLAQQAIENPDLPLLQAMTQVAVVYVVLGNLISDLVSARVDPRTR